MAKISEYLQQEENNLICISDCIVTIDVTNYIKGDTILIEESTIWVKQLMAKIEFGNVLFNLILDYGIRLNIQEIKEIENSITLKYTKNSIVLYADIEAVEIKQQVLYIERLLGGRVIFKDVDHLFRKLYSVYGPITSGMDLVHIEVLLSQCLRDQDDTTQPARVGKKWDPIMMNIKNIVFHSGFINSVAFENINKAITTGLTSEKELPASVLERVVTGELKK